MIYGNNQVRSHPIENVEFRDGSEAGQSLFLSFFERLNNSECDRPSLNPI